ncbi:Flagellar protein FliS [Pseudidiomarina piscicola]|uniref:Flagellar secretion chaperone FliS n=1 Tax=Pseudidiomarina piscicola TaxID=2614830 RepID=A0A6S6WNJ2_9GAMM|nr:flagellar export chaperone FliS [Pseudidiomarina piscicola]CAB0151061.1 Flagellar protein FliS [Pseudidiomarina piscicola]VZT40571.1 Flagellar protein FliS [Pseudomonas aeruginosa]
MYGMKGAAAYGRVDVETEVLSASSHKLIALLFAKCLSHLKAAKIHLDAGNTALKGEAIGKALRIVTEGLQVSLDQEQGGAIAAQLDALYDYAANELIQANLHNDRQRLVAVEKVLTELAEAWNGIAKETVGG